MWRSNDLTATWLRVLLLALERRAADTGDEFIAHAAELPALTGYFGSHRADMPWRRMRELAEVTPVRVWWQDTEGDWHDLEEEEPPSRDRSRAARKVGGSDAGRGVSADHPREKGADSARVARRVPGGSYRIRVPNLADKQGFVPKNRTSPTAQAPTTHTPTAEAQPPLFAEVAATASRDSIDPSKLPGHDLLPPSFPTWPRAWWEERVNELLIACESGDREHVADLPDGTSIAFSGLPTVVGWLAVTWAAIVSKSKTPRSRKQTATTWWRRNLGQIQAAKGGELRNVVQSELLQAERHGEHAFGTQTYQRHRRVFRKRLKEAQGRKKEKH